MADLFDDLPVPDVNWYPEWLAPATAAYALKQLIDEVEWRQDMMGTPAGRVPLPRLTAWQGEPEAVYVYSGIRNVPQSWTPTVAELRAAGIDVRGPLPPDPMVCFFTRIFSTHCFRCTLAIVCFLVLHRQRTNLLHCPWIDRVFLLGEGRKSNADCQNYYGNL